MQDKNMKDKRQETIIEKRIIGKSNWRYENLIKVKHKVEKEDHYEITFNSVVEDSNIIKEFKLIFILPK